MSDATGLYTLMRQLGGSLGIAILELLQTRREDYVQALLAADVTLASGPVASLLHGATSRAHGLAMLSGMVVQNATMISYA